MRSHLRAGAVVVGFVAGALSGVLVLGTIQTLIAFDGTLSAWWTKIVIGGLLFVFCAVQRLLAQLDAEWEHLKRVRQKYVGVVAPWGSPRAAGQPAAAEPAAGAAVITTSASIVALIHRPFCRPCRRLLR